MPIRLSDDVSVLKGVGLKKRSILSAAGIDTVSDMLYYFPRTWEDRRRRLKIAELKEGISAGFTAKVISVKKPMRNFRSGKRTPLVVVVGDETGAIETVFFSAAYMDRIFTEGSEFYFFGEPSRNYGKLSIVHPEFERADDSEFSMYMIMPVYPLKAGISQTEMRRWHAEALFALEVAGTKEEFLPTSVIENLNLCDIGYALTNINFPSDKHSLSAARYRLIFEELFMLAVSLEIIRESNNDGAKGISFANLTEADDFAGLLSFEMTDAQRRSVEEIYADMSSPRRMNRLVQGDVGSGKTAVAMAAVFKAAANGYQSVMMAPTEILATQHYGEFCSVFGNMNIRLLTASVRASERAEILSELAAGNIDLLIGTHALLVPDVIFGKLGLVITDEQHRFGVNQRIVLSEKSDVKPDILVMTATPIPRTLAFILYGDLDVSVIDEMPPGRKPVVTKAVGSDKRDDVYAFVSEQVALGHQAYVVCPLIEENADSDVMAGVSAAENVYDELSKKFTNRKTALLHGGMKQTEKDSIMDEFTSGNTDILVSTVVIEVGINVPNATVMVVENSERFGLAQLHQLRGRVGRGADKSYCVLITDSKSEEAMRRAEIMTETNDGFVIAEQDLIMRGPGEFFGIRQHGLPELKISDITKNASMLETVKTESARLMKEDARLVMPENAALRSRIERTVSGLSNPGL